MSKPMIVVLALALGACAPPMSEQPRTADPARAAGEASGAERTCVIGTLTNEGVECPAMQTLTGEVYTLLGDLQGKEAGDLVCACGAEADMSTCMQGTTLELTEIGSPSLCP